MRMNISLYGSSGTNYLKEGQKLQFSDFRMGNYKREDLISKWLINNNVDNFYILGDLPIVYFYSNKEYPYIFK